MNSLRRLYSSSVTCAYDDDSATCTSWPGVTTKRRLRCAQPPSLGVRRASPAAPRGARPASVALGDDASKWGEKRLSIMTNYIAIYLVPRVLHACYSVREVSDAESRGPSGPRSRVRSPEGFSRNQYVTPVAAKCSAFFNMFTPDIYGDVRVQLYCGVGIVLIFCSAGFLSVWRLCVQGLEFHSRGSTSCSSALEDAGQII